MGRHIDFGVRAGEEAQWLRALAGLAEDLSLVFSTNTRQLPGGCPCGFSSHCTHIVQILYIDNQAHTYTHN